MTDPFDLPREPLPPELEQRLRTRVLTEFRHGPTPSPRQRRGAPVLAAAAAAAALIGGGLLIASPEHPEQAAASWERVDTVALSSQVGQSLAAALPTWVGGVDDVTVQAAKPDSKLIGGTIEFTHFGQPAMVGFQVSRHRYQPSTTAPPKAVVDRSGLQLTLYTTSTAEWISSHVQRSPKVVADGQLTGNDLGFFTLRRLASSQLVRLPAATALRDLYDVPPAAAPTRSFTAPTLPEIGRERPTMVSPEGFGKVRIGMSTQSLLALGGAITDQRASTDSQRCEVVEMPDASVVQVHGRDGVTVIDPSTPVRTPEKVENGSSPEQLRSAYPDLRVDEQNVAHGGAYEFTLIDHRVHDLRVVSGRPCVP